MNDNCKPDSAVELKLPPAKAGGKGTGRRVLGGGGGGGGGSKKKAGRKPRVVTLNSMGAGCGAGG